MCVCVCVSSSVVSNSLQLYGQAPLSIGILQARILEWVAIPFSGESSWPRDQTQVSCIAGRFFTIWATRDAHNVIYTLWGERKLAKMACSGSLAPCFINNDCNIDITYSTGHACHEVVACHRLLYFVWFACRSSTMKPLITAASRLCLSGQPQEERI